MSRDIETTAEAQALAAGQAYAVWQAMMDIERLRPDLELYDNPYWLVQRDEAWFSFLKLFGRV